MIHWKLVAIGIVVLSTLMANVISKLETSFDVIAHYAVMVTSANTAPHTHGVASALVSNGEANVKNEVNVLRDSFLLSWLVGGMIPGSCVGIWIRALTKIADIGKTFGVSLFTSFCVSPWLIKNYLLPSPETCLLIGFLVAVGSWIAWEVVLDIAVRIKAAAIKGGWVAVKNEVLGGPVVAAQEQSTPTVTDSQPPPPKV